MAPTLLVLALALGACSGPGASRRGSAPPPAGALATLAEASAGTAEVLANGATLVLVDGEPETVRVAFVVRAGPLDDPPDLPGLTSFVIEAALLGSAGDPDPETRPPRRALLLGASLEPVESLGTLGWVAVGPTDRAEALWQLTLDVATRPTFPATRVIQRAEVARERVRQALDQDFRRAMSVAFGNALGLERPLVLHPDPSAFAKLNREDVTRHYRRVVHPDQVAVVVAAPREGREALLARIRSDLEAWSPERLARLDAPETCSPRKRSSHLVLQTGGDTDHVVTLVALRAPGLSHPARRPMEHALQALGGTPWGIIEGLVGPERAAQASPRMLDLGGRRAEAALLLGSSGSPRDALLDLWRVVERLEEVAGQGAPDEIDALAARADATGRLLEAAHPIEGLLRAGARALYPPTPPAGLDETLSSWLDREAMVVVGVGPPELAGILRRFGPVTIWNDQGKIVGGAGPPRCR